MLSTKFAGLKVIIQYFGCVVRFPPEESFGAALSILPSMTFPQFAHCMTHSPMSLINPAPSVGISRLSLSRPKTQNAQCMSNNTTYNQKSPPFQPLGHLLTEVITPSTIPNILILSSSTLSLSFSASLNSTSNSSIRRSCSSFEFSTPGRTEMMYSICFVFRIRSCASSRWAAAKVVGESGLCSGGREEGSGWSCEVGGWVD